MSNTMGKSKIKSITNCVLNALIGIFSFILFTILLLNFQTIFLGEEYNSFFGFSFFEVETGSMEPTIEIGDWIITKAEMSYDLNDIITYKEKNAFVTHRVIQVYQDTYVTKGDSNNTIDDSIKKQDIVGKVILILPRVGFIKKVLLNPKFIIGFIVLLLILCTLIDDGKKSTLKSILKINNKKDIKEDNIKPDENIKQDENIQQTIKTTENNTEDDDLLLAKDAFSTLKKQNIEDSKTKILSPIDVDLQVPELNEAPKIEDVNNNNK